MSLSQKALLPVSSPDIRQIMTTVEYGVVGLANDTQANAAAMTIWIAPPHVDKSACFSVKKAGVGWWKELPARWFLRRWPGAFALFVFQRFVGGEQKKGGGGQSRPAPSRPGQAKPEKEREKEQERVKKGKTRGQLALVSETTGEI